MWLRGSWSQYHHMKLMFKTQNSAWEGIGVQAHQNLEELCLLFGNCPLRQPQGRWVLSEAVVGILESSLYHDHLYLDRLCTM